MRTGVSLTHRLPQLCQSAAADPPPLHFKYRDLRPLFMTESVRHSAHDADPPDVSDADKQRSRNHHGLVLAMCAAVVGLACVLRVTADQRVEFVGFEGVPLPRACISRTVFHVDCPGCGLTRSFIHLAAGRVDQSWSVNRVGWLLFIVLMIQFPYRISAIMRLRSDRPEFLPGSSTLVWAVLIAALIGNWLCKVSGI